MSNWLEILLGENNQFMPHGHCYLWRPDILWTHVVSDGLISLAYLSIPFSIALVVRHRINSPTFIAAILSAAFIIMCGLTHLFNIYVVWNPAYEMQSYIKAITAVVSVTAAILIAAKCKHFSSLLDVEDSNKKLKEALAEKEESEDQFSRVLDASESRELRIIELKQEVNELLTANSKPERYNLGKIY